ncbi:hypothetical protein [Gordonia shandongensis]|uniref:hypothetical protein n=1 Tax=Gordonia shandongensis TaxID=376351 RepID=UPI0012EB0E53|nr:hypothetical protein [Gordonia shandongensis]
MILVRTRLVPTVAVCAALLTACGGAADDSAAPSGAPSSAVQSSTVQSPGAVDRYLSTLRDAGVGLDRDAAIAEGRRVCAEAFCPIS